jgi:hypothetical protein
VLGEKCAFRGIELIDALDRADIHASTILHVDAGLGVMAMPLMTASSTQLLGTAGIGSVGATNSINLESERRADERGGEMTGRSFGNPVDLAADAPCRSSATPAWRPTVQCRPTRRIRRAERRRPPRPILVIGGPATVHTLDAFDEDADK